MKRRYRYMMKLYDGRLLFAEGEEWEDAAKSLGLELSDVKRIMPVEAILTPEEKAKRDERLAKLRARKEGNEDNDDK